MVRVWSGFVAMGFEVRGGLNPSRKMRNFYRISGSYQTSDGKRFVALEVAVHGIVSVLKKFTISAERIRAKNVCFMVDQPIASEQNKSTICG